MTDMQGATVMPSERPVYLLAPDSRQGAVLVESTPDGAIRLPLLGPIADSEAHPPIAALLAGFLGAAHPILRVLEAGEDPACGSTDILVVVEPLADDGPEAVTWVPLGDPRLAGLRSDPVTGPHVGRWLDELETGVIDSRRQPWNTRASRPGPVDG